MLIVNLIKFLLCGLKCLLIYLAKTVIAAGSQNVRPVVDEGDGVHVVIVRVDSERKLEFHVQKCGKIASKSAFVSLRI